MKEPRYKLREKVYSYQNPYEKMEISHIAKSDDPKYSHRYKLALKEGGYSRSSNWINEESLSKMPQGSKHKIKPKTITINKRGVVSKRNVHDVKNTMKHPLSSPRIPGEWFKEMDEKIKSKEPNYTEDQRHATIGYIWYHELSDEKRKEIKQKYNKK